MNRNGRIETQESAQRACNSLNAALAEGKTPRPSNIEHDRVIDRFEVRPFSFRHSTLTGTTNCPDSWGIWPRWSYGDRPDLGTNFGGPFMPANEAIGYASSVN